MVEVMKIMLTSFKRSHALLHSVPLTLQQATTDPPPETPGHSRASLGQSLVGSLLFSPESWCAQHFVCVDHNKLWKVLQEMEIPEHLTYLLRNLYTGQEATVNRIWNNRLVPNWGRSTSRLYIVTLLI